MPRMGARARMCTRSGVVGKNLPLSSEPPQDALHAGIASTSENRALFDLVAWLFFQSFDRVPRCSLC